MEELSSQMCELNMAPRRWVSDGTYRMQMLRDLGVLDQT